METQEAMTAVAVRKKRQISLGIPKELERFEKRVALRPEAVALLVNNGFDVLLEAGAGAPSKHADMEYEAAGARIVYETKEAFGADLVLKVSPPTSEEIGLMKKGKAIMSALQMSTMTKDYLCRLNERKITAIGFELIRDRNGSLPVVRAMSEIAGSSVMLIAAEYLSTVNDGKGIILGGITGVPPTKVVIVGAGTVAEYAARTALGLGAEVKVFDNHLYKLHRLKQSLGNHHLYNSTIDSVMLGEALAQADVAVGALRAESGRTPCVVTEEMVANMKPNSIIIDVSIDSGGCFETSEVTTLERPVFRKYDVIHFGLPNIASRVARTATSAFSNYLTPLLLRIQEVGGVEDMIFNDAGFAKGVYSYAGGLTSEPLARKFNMRYRDIELIMAAKMG